MRAVIQRVTSASVVVEEETIGSIGQGYLILLGVGEGDTREVAQKLWAKIRDLRIMPDDAGKTNRSLADVSGEVLVVSQFTLYADCRKGNRPSFINAGAPDMAKKLYEYIIEKCKESVAVVEQGEFGADMKVELLNDGPFTIILDSDDLA